MYGLPVRSRSRPGSGESRYRAVDDRQAARAGDRDERRQDADRARPRAARDDGPRARRTRSLGGGQRADLLPADGTDTAPEREAEVAREWRERLVRAHAGDGAHSMLRVLLADLPRVHTPWEQVLRTQLARALAPLPSVSWSRPSRSYLAHQGRAGPGRRMPFEPGITPTRSVPKLVLVVDVSGSIGEALLQRFVREVEAITRRLRAGLVLVIGDDRVRQVQRFAPGRCRLGELAAHGGGGTDFTPMLQEADRHDPDITVVLTDLDGPARFRPRSRVLWAVPESLAAGAPPFGRKLVLAR